MSAALARPLSFPDISLNEIDQDPNAALLELDRGLKSSNVGEQCEAISRFPSLFEKYPFPILINSAMLKLAEVFRQEAAGSNFVRVCVCEVLEASGRHLDKMINVEEFLRRITTVMHSNDPLARALTLGALGLLCGVVGEVKQVQHLIRDALDATHSLELQAAIVAAEKYTAVSKTFAVSMCERLTQMLSALSTPVEVKLQLIKVFQHMHHDAETAATVRSVCVQLLERCPTQNVVITTLHALTQLAAHCLVQIPSQVDLILMWVSKETRARVREAALNELLCLASAAPHAWSQGNVGALVTLTRASRAGHVGVLSEQHDRSGSSHNQPCNGTSANLPLAAASSSEHDRTTAAALEVLATLTSAPALPQLDLTPSSDLVKLSREFVYDPNIAIATTALQLYTNVALYMHEERSTQGVNAASGSGSVDCGASVAVCRDALNAAISLLRCIALRSHDEAPATAHKVFKIPLVSSVLLARCHDKLEAGLSSTLVSLLTDDSLPPSSNCSVVVCEALASLGGSRRGVLGPHLPSLLGLLHSTTMCGKGSSPVCRKLISLLCSVIFQAYLGHAWDSIGSEAVLTAANCTDNWTTYRIARQAARYGHHQIAGTLYGELRNSVCSDQQHYWLTALQQVSSGEAWTVSPAESSAALPSDGAITTDVVDDRAKPLTAAAACMYRALANFKACGSAQAPLEFVQQYTRLRATSLSCHAQLFTTCQSMRTSPRPAIAAAQVGAMRDEIFRCCRLLQQLNKLAKDFTDVAEDYAKLYQSQFDADPQTLSNIRALQRGARLMARSISVLTRPAADHHSYQGAGKASPSVEESSLPSCAGSGEERVQEQLLNKAIAKANKTIAELEQLCAEKKPILECQLQVLTMVSEQLTGVPLPYPRLFYQRLQHTAITLNVTPQPRALGEPHIIQNSSQLAVKVEGVIKHGRRPGLFRSVRSVTLLVCSTLQNRPQYPLDVKVEPNETLSQTVEPHNDFFSAQFLLSFPVQGLYQVTVDASGTDDSDETWQTGPRYSLPVKVQEDPTGTKTQQSVTGAGVVPQQPPQGMPPQQPLRPPLPPQGPGIPPQMPPHHGMSYPTQMQQQPLMPMPSNITGVGGMQYQVTPSTPPPSQGLPLPPGMQMSTHCAQVSPMTYSNAVPQAGPSSMGINYPR